MIYTLITVGATRLGCRSSHGRRYICRWETVVSVLVLLLMGYTFFRNTRPTGWCRQLRGPLQGRKTLLGGVALESLPQLDDTLLCPPTKVSDYSAGLVDLITCPSQCVGFVLSIEGAG